MKKKKITARHSLQRCSDQREQERNESQIKKKKKKSNCYGAHKKESHAGEREEAQLQKNEGFQPREFLSLLFFQNNKASRGPNQHSKPLGKPSQQANTVANNIPLDVCVYQEQQQAPG